MTFDVFGDFETRGYLRNARGLKATYEIKELELRYFLKNVRAACERLASVETISYQDVLQTHKKLFGEVYPTWAGQDRAATAPNIGISKGGRDDLFAHPLDAAFAVNHALERGQDKKYMRAHPGEVMGYLAHGHPFLDGNGRTIMVVHNEMTWRAGFSIDWRSSDNQKYLQALTKELDRPGAGHLDRYLKPFIGARVRRPRHQPALRGDQPRRRRE